MVCFILYYLPKRERDRKRITYNSRKKNNNINNFNTLQIIYTQENRKLGFKGGCGWFKQFLSEPLQIKRNVNTTKTELLLIVEERKNAIQNVLHS